MKILIIAFILILIIIYTIIDSYLYLNYNKTIYNIIFQNKPLDNNINTNLDINYNIDKNDIDLDVDFDVDRNNKKELLIKYSSIKNKLETENDYLDFQLFIQNIKNSIYVSIIDNIIYNENQILELITNDILKTRLKFNFKKLKNIFIINKLKDDYNKIIIFYDGLLYNEKRFKFIENDFTGNTIVYKVNLNHKLISHHLQ